MNSTIYNFSFTIPQTDYDEDGLASVDLTDEVADKIRNFYRKYNLTENGENTSNPDYDYRLMKSELSDIFKKIDDAIMEEAKHTLVNNGIANGYVEPDEEELHENFKEALLSGEFLPEDAPNDADPTDYIDDEDTYDEWYEQEQENMDDPDYVTENYDVDGQVNLYDIGDIACDIPKELR